jgi:hypothetical protein
MPVMSLHLTIMLIIRYGDRCYLSAVTRFVFTLNLLGRFFYSCKNRWSDAQR